MLGASVMEFYLLHPSVWMFLGVGLIEEAVKLAALMFVLRRYPHIHGLWTPIAGGVLLSFRRPNGHFHLAAPVIGTYLSVAVLESPSGWWPGWPTPD
ncbi:hypothetical protein [Streptomyces sp. NPDC055749]